MTYCIFGHKHSTQPPSDVLSTIRDVAWYNDDMVLTEHYRNIRDLWVDLSGRDNSDDWLHLATLSNAVCHLLRHHKCKDRDKYIEALKLIEQELFSLCLLESKVK